MATEAGYLGKVTIAGTVKVLEIGNWNIAGQEISIVEDSQFGDNFKSFVSSQGDGGIITVAGNYDPADTTGQIALLTLFANKNSTNTIRLYFGSGLTDFFYCKGDVECFVESINDLGVDQTGLGTIEFQLKVSEGWMRKADASYDATDTYHCSINATAKTFTKITGGGTFGSAGFLETQEITVRGFNVSTNNIEYTIAGGGVAADVLTVTTTPPGGDEGSDVNARIIGKTV